MVIKKTSTKEKASTTATQMKAIEKNRNDTYGGIYHSHASYGRIWAGLLSQHFERVVPAIPPHVVAGMLASMKLARDVVPRSYNPDNNVDGQNYTSFMPRLDPRNPECEEHEREDFEQ